ncbi:hypothetical protein [Sphingomonas sp.]|uniref:hypothetical protein n=1 Tax=Sphingomonas sp. TaxID=28214 RepID=UPI003D6D447A
MGGDSMGALAAVIFGAMILILLAGFGIGFFLGRFIAGRLGWRDCKRALAALGTGAAGLCIGALIVIATFFESTWSPPPMIRFDVPPGFAPHWVILLEDHNAPTAVAWQGVELPFSGKSAVIRVPRSGVVRVRDLSEIAGRGDIRAQWSDGARNRGLASGPAPRGSGATLFSAFERNGPNAPGNEDPPFIDEAALAAYIAARERAP